LALLTFCIFVTAKLPPLRADNEVVALCVAENGALREILASERERETPNSNNRIFLHNFPA
jgi:hypothetical protein